MNLGYKAFRKLMERELERVEKRAPKRRVKRKSAQYWAGQRDALLMLHCTLAWVDFPHVNAKEIKRELQTP